MSYHQNYHHSTDDAEADNHEPSIPISTPMYSAHPPPPPNMLMYPPNHQMMYAPYFQYHPHHPPPLHHHHHHHQYPFPLPPPHYHNYPMVPSHTPPVSTPTPTPIPPPPNTNTTTATVSSSVYPNDEEVSLNEPPPPFPSASSATEEIETTAEKDQKRQRKEQHSIKNKSDDDHEPYTSSSQHPPSLKSSVHRCTQLTLQQKVEVLQMIDQKIPYREIALQYNIAHSTISGIKKTKAEIIQLVQKRANLSMHRIHKSMPMTSKQLDERMYSWYLSNRHQNIAVNGKQLQQKALEFAKELNLVDFKASNGWLDSFKRRHQILLKQHADG